MVGGVESGAWPLSEGAAATATNTLKSLRQLSTEQGEKMACEYFKVLVQGGVAGRAQYSVMGRQWPKN